MAVIPTNMPGNVSSWPYAPVGGSLPIQSNQMPQDAASWPALQSIQLCWALNFLVATHVCSYSCFTSQFVPGGAAANMSDCWLSPQPAGAPGSACPTWGAISYPQMEAGGAPQAAPAPAVPAPAAPAPAPAAADGATLLKASTSVAPAARRVASEVLPTLVAAVTLLVALPL